jgi:hypothetical protein
MITTEKNTGDHTHDSSSEDPHTHLMEELKLPMVKMNVSMQESAKIPLRKSETMISRKHCCGDIDDPAMARKHKQNLKEIMRGTKLKDLDKVIED